MKGSSHLSTGILGENLAVKFLTSHGYKIIERNFKKRYGDIDIVALDDETLVFVEVKTRKSDEYGPGEDTITPYKMRSLVKSSQYYCYKKEIEDKPMRIDLVCVEMTDDLKVQKIEVYKNITG